MVKQYIIKGNLPGQLGEGNGFEIISNFLDFKGKIAHVHMFALPCSHTFSVTILSLPQSISQCYNIREACFIYFYYLLAYNGLGGDFYE